MVKPKLSVCFITYNQIQYVRESLESILAQKVNFPWEIIIADDYSTDGTRDVILEYKKKYPDLIKTIFQKKNVGAERNWIDLVSYPKSKYIAYLEGDDYWTDVNKLQQQVDFLEKNLSYVMCFHLAKIFFENGEDVQSVWPNINKDTKITVCELLKENFIPSNAVVYRRQDYSELPLGIMPGDWYFHLYHARFGKIGLINKVMSAYRRHSGGMWWDSHADKDKLWKTYGLPHATMYNELLKLYGSDPEKREIIYRGLGLTINNIISADKKFNGQNLRAVLAKFPDVIEPVMTDQYEVIKDHQKHIEKDNQEIQRLNEAIMGVRGDLFKTRDELHTFRNSRLVGRAIKLRQYLSVQLPRFMRLHKTVPRRLSLLTARYMPVMPPAMKAWPQRLSLFMASCMPTIPPYMKTWPHYFKWWISPYLPEPLKIVLRKIRSLIQSIDRKIKIRRQSKGMRYITVTNKKIKSSAPLVSVVIPYYNLADTIDETLDSLEVQTFRNFETIIINDGSTDSDAIEKLEHIKLTRPGVNITSQKNQGVAAARNTGISQSKGRYIICLDSDDILDTTFIEKCTTVLEATPDVSLVTTQMEMFGVIREPFKHQSYNALDLSSNNMIITAAEFTKKAWGDVGGYKSKIGYEDWDYWLTLAEKGFWGKSLTEPLFKYRTSSHSRYVADRDVHWSNIKAIRSLHPSYRRKIKKLHKERRNVMNLTDPQTAFVNMNDAADFSPTDSNKDNILITVPWMTFGGAETLIYNYCREIKDKFNISFISGLQSDNEWEYKFREITPKIYHLANLFDDVRLHIEFVSNYIATRKIDVLHIVHNGFMFEMLPELKKRHPRLKVILTLFNDRVEYFERSLGFAEYIDIFTSDNAKVTKHFQKDLGKGAKTTVIPNGINCYDEFNPKLFDIAKERKALGIETDELAIFFVGRLSVEKNPDVFLRVAAHILREVKNKHIKFFLIGDGPMRYEVERDIKAIGSNKITFLGYQTDVARYFSAADIFVLPSSIEGFPLSILEAMAMRVAVVASDVGAVGEVISSGEDGFVVVPGSVLEIIDRIVALQGNPELLASIKDQARQKVESKYSNRLLGANYQNLYNEFSE